MVKSPASPPVRPWSHRLAAPIVMMGVPFDQVTTPQALEIIGEMIDSRRPHMLATANVDFLAQVQEDVSLRSILLGTDLVVCDGTPLLWMSRLLGSPLPERVAGSDLVPLLLDLASARGHRVYFLGGREEVLETARAKIRERWPALRIAGMYSPPFAPLEKMDHADIRRRIQEARADILLVSFGCPKQEKWLAMNYQETGVPVAIGVGATIDFLAGTMKRAPVWMRKAGLEWVFRALQEPRRLMRRYWYDIRIVVPGLARQILTMRGRQETPPLPGPRGVSYNSVSASAKVPGPGAAAEALSGWPPLVKPLEPSPPTAAATSPATPSASPSVPMECLILTLPPRLDALSARDASLWTGMDANTAAWIIADASATKFIDSTGTGKLIRLARTARERGGRVILAGATQEVTGPLALMKLRGFFEEAPDLESALALIPQAQAV